MTPPAPPLPGAAIAAALLGLVTATVPVLVVLLISVMAAGKGDAAFWLPLLAPLGMSVWLAGGAILLLVGRSWLALTLPAAVLAGIALAGFTFGGAVGSFVLTAFLVGLVTAVLAALPGVRRWVAQRRELRAARPTVAAT